MGTIIYFVAFVYFPIIKQGAELEDKIIELKQEQLKKEEELKVILEKEYEAIKRKQEEKNREIEENFYN
jgi:glycogen synthase